MKRRGFFGKALGLGALATAAATESVLPRGEKAPQVILVERETVKEVALTQNLPPLLTPAEDEEDLATLRMLRDSTTVSIALAYAQDVTINGLQFRLPQGSSDVPKPIWDVYRQGQIDRESGMREVLRRRYPDTFRG